MDLFVQFAGTRHPSTLLTFASQLSAGTFASQLSAGTFVWQISAGRTGAVPLHSAF